MGSLPVSRMAAQATWRRHFYRTIRREYAKSGSAHLGRGLRIGSARVFLGENGFLRENGSRMFFFPFLLLFFLSFLSLLFFFKFYSYLGENLLLLFFMIQQKQDPSTG